MQIIILGSNSVSIALAETLNQANHDITIVSSNKDALLKLDHKLDIKTIHGVPSYPQSLYQAQAGAADIIIAATTNDEMNMTACQIAYSLFKTPKKIAVIHTSQYFANQALFANTDLPIDITINPSQLMAQHIFQLLGPQQPEVFISHSNIQAIALKIEKTPNNKYPTYQEMALHYNIAIPAITTSNNLSKAQTTTIRQHETALLVGEANNLQAAITELTDTTFHKKKIIIAGGQATSIYLAAICAHKHHVTIVEPNLATCQKIARQLPNITVLNGVASNNLLLTQEGIADTDVFCALTEDDEDNILMALQAKHLLAKKTIAIVTQDNYIGILNQNIVDYIISPKKILKTYITPYTRPVELTNNIHFIGNNLEIIAIQRQHLNDKILKSHGHVICGVIENDNFIAGNSSIANKNYTNAIFVIHNQDQLTKLEKLICTT